MFLLLLFCVIGAETFRSLDEDRVQLLRMQQNVSPPARRRTSERPHHSRGSLLDDSDVVIDVESGEQLSCGKTDQHSIISPCCYLTSECEIDSRSPATAAGDHNVGKCLGRCSVESSRRSSPGTHVHLVRQQFLLCHESVVLQMCEATPACFSLVT